MCVASLGGGQLSCGAPRAVLRVKLEKAERTVRIYSILLTGNWPGTSHTQRRDSSILLSIFHATWLGLRLYGFRPSSTQRHTALYSYLYTRRHASPPKSKSHGRTKSEMFICPQKVARCGGGGRHERARALRRALSRTPRARAHLRRDPRTRSASLVKLPVPIDTAVLLAAALLSMPPAWGGTLGFVIAAVSPAVVVPGMLILQAVLSA